MRGRGNRGVRRGDRADAGAGITSGRGHRGVRRGGEASAGASIAPSGGRRGHGVALWTPRLHAYKVYVYIYMMLLGALGFHSIDEAPFSHA